MNKLNLPTANDNSLLIWDAGKNKCGGYLQKKASQTSAFSKGKWQKRYFTIPLELSASSKDNYSLEYYHNPEDKLPRAIMSLAGATVKISSTTAFSINFPDGNSISLNAESGENMQQWIGTLEHVISVANLREKMLSHYSRDADDEEDENEGERGGYEEKGDTDSRRGGGDSDILRQFKSSKGVSGAHRHVKKVSDKGWPTVRLDFDSNALPPSSTERHRFIEMFSNDIANSLSIDAAFVEVISIKSAPGMDWLSLVEFDLSLWDAHHHSRHLAENSDADSISTSENHFARKKEARKKLLKNLYDLIQDPSSVLYNGYITSKIDPSFTLNFDEKNNNQNQGQQGSSLSSPVRKSVHGSDDNKLPVSSSNSMQLDMFSENIEIMKIMQKYKNVVIPDDFEDQSFFHITLHFEGRVGVVSVPNPVTLTKRYCALWPFEVKTALGFLGTMQEMWINPVELIPRDTVTKPTPIPFTPSVRLGGQLVINAVHLTPDGSYDVKCTDRRDEALNSLTPEEMDSIKETFQQCDLDGDGGISKYEMEEIIRERIVERKNLIESKFQQFLSDNQESLTEDDIEFAEQNKSQYLQTLHESQTKLLKMFEAADLNGDGSISFTEFILAEAWWLRCTINPEKVHLF
jgi:Ca2+-binding EF-hand superfamily protein